MTSESRPRAIALALQQEAEKNKVAGSANQKGWDAGDLKLKQEEESQKAAEITQGVQMRLTFFPVERWEKAVTLHAGQEARHAHLPG